MLLSYGFVEHTFNKFCDLHLCMWMLHINCFKRFHIWLAKLCWPNNIKRNNAFLEWPLVALALMWWHLYQWKQDRLEGVWQKVPRRQIFLLWNGLGEREDVGRNHSKVNYILRRELGPSAKQHSTSIESWNIDCEGLLKGSTAKVSISKTKTSMKGRSYRT